MASSITTRVLELSWISPPPNSVPDTSVPLTYYDIPWLNTPPVHHIFLYHSLEPAVSLIEPLKSSLSLTLQHFYTLAGTIHISSNTIDIVCTNRDAVAFTVVESNSSFHPLASIQNRDYFTQIYPLLPQLSGLLAIQVTVFPDHGICIGVTIQHVVGDGASTTDFMKSWASTCKSGALTATPIYDRGLIAESPQFYEMLYSQYVQSKPVTHVSPTPAKGAILATFGLRRDQIERLKNLVRDHGEQTHCSTFVVSCAYAWVCHVRALGYVNDSTVHFMFPVDSRRRLDPPLPPSYFGNCLTSGLVDESVSVLTGENGFVAAAVGIGKAVEELNDGFIEYDLQVWKRLMTISDEKVLSVGRSPNFRIYDVDFGWGRPVRVEMPSIERNRDISLTEARNGDGVEIGVALEKIEMGEFEAHFYLGLSKLSE